MMKYLKLYGDISVINLIFRFLVCLKDNVEEKLRNYGVSDELIKDFLNALNECEFARFAPGDESQAMDKVYSSSLEVMSKMENSIKR